VFHLHWSVNLFTHSHQRNDPGTFEGNSMKRELYQLKKKSSNQ
jgi:hypothetical protein